MEPIRPIVRRTYGKQRIETDHASSPLSHRSFLSSSSLASGSTSTSYISFCSSSSPPSSSVLVTPPTSPFYSRDGEDVQSSPSRKGVSSVFRPSAVDRKGKIETEKGGSVQENLKSFFAPLPNKKRPLQLSTIQPSIPPTSSPAAKSSKPLTQLHLTHLPLLHTCQQCQMSYVRGGDDEDVHEKHHTRVVRGIPWDGLGRGVGRSKARGNGMGQDRGWRVVSEDIRFGATGKGKGKVVVCDGSWGGTKLNEILTTVDTVLSSPPLPQPILDQCKIILFITSDPPPLSTTKKRRLQPGDLTNGKKQKERVVGVVVSQGIKWALRVLKDGEVVEGRVMDSGGGVVCDPKSLPTPLGIHRLFTIPSYRSLGLAQIMLNAACANTVYGCTFSPEKGEVAFSQPTQGGRAVMEAWGGGCVRVFVDDESQL